MKKLIIFLAFTCIPNVLGNDDSFFDEGDFWVLEANSNKLSSDSKVLYYMPSDAYNTHHAREYGNWDTFSMVDSRNIERLSKGDIIQIIEAKYSKKVYKVKLLSGYNKNRNFYVITEDLLNYYEPIHEEIDE